MKVMARYKKHDQSEKERELELLSTLSIATSATLEAEGGKGTEGRAVMIEEGRTVVDKAEVVKGSGELAVEEELYRAVAEVLEWAAEGGAVGAEVGT